MRFQFLNFKGISLIKLKTKILKRISLIKLKAILIFWWYKIEGEFLIRVLSALNPHPSLSASLRGPAIALRQRKKGRRAQASLMGRTDGRDGTDGTDGPQKCPLIFFILRYNKHYTHIYLYIYKKIVPTNFLWV